MPALGDGRVTIRCRKCGEVICVMAYQGFSTALCSKCQGIQLPEVVDPDLIDDDISLYNDTEDTAEDREGLAKRLFRALGFGKAKDTPQVPKTDSSSAKVAQSKKRKPLFSEDND